MGTKDMKKGIIAIFLIIQTIIYIIVGTQKEYIHIDEAYSYGLSNYDKIEIENNEDFFNKWHSKEYYNDYLTVQKDEINNFKPVYENQKNDVHPPFYYLLLKIFMNFSGDNFSKWTGIGLNIVIYAFITIFMYLILKRLVNEDEKNANIKAIILAFVSSVTLASLSNVIYIRMYALLTLEILITTFMHIKIIESKKQTPKLLIGIAISVLAGILTHYYYIIYLAILYIVFIIKYIKERKIKEIINYTLTMLITGIVSLIIFPYSIQHMFFGYRGQGVISNLENIHEIIPSIISQIHNLNYYGFNNLMYIILGIIIVLLIYKKIFKKDILKISKEQKEILKIIYIPAIFFFIIATIASPWRVLRYIVPVCGLIFIIAIYYLYKLLQTTFSEKISNMLITILFCAIIATPFICKMEPELLYSDRKELVQKLDEELNLPTIYLYNSEKAGFLNDILLFSIIDESYIAKDIKYTENNIEKILENKDISNGIIIFINEEDNNTIINKIKSYLNFTNYEHLKRLSTCDVYYVK